MAMTAWSERLHQLDLSGGERAHLVPAHADDANERAVAPFQRYPKYRAEAAGALLRVKPVVGVFEHVRDLNDPFLDRDAADHAVAAALS